jgi:hypothetical protein
VTFGTIVLDGSDRSPSRILKAFWSSLGFSERKGTDESGQAALAQGDSPKLFANLRIHRFSGYAIFDK